MSGKAGRLPLAASPFWEKRGLPKGERCHRRLKTSLRRVGRRNRPHFRRKNASASLRPSGTYCAHKRSDLRHGVAGPTASPRHARGAERRYVVDCGEAGRILVKTIRIYAHRCAFYGTGCQSNCIREARGSRHSSSIRAIARGSFSFWQRRPANWNRGQWPKAEGVARRHQPRSARCDL